MNSHYLTNHSRYIYIVISLVSLVVFMGVFFYIFPKVLCLQLYLFGLGLFGIYNLIQKVRNEHIIVSEKGIEYYAPGVIFETNWKSIERISKYWHNGFRQDCLLVDSSQIRMKKWSFFLGRNLPMPFGFTLNKTLIPLSSFSENWRDSELGQQIKQYAPYLFEEKSVQST